jgi:hypothetical protein
MLGRDYRGGPVPQGHILADYRRFDDWSEDDDRDTKDLLRLEGFHARQVDSHSQYFMWSIA